MIQTTENAETLIDWGQVNDLIGDSANLEQREMLAGIWHDMRADVAAAWGKLVECTDEAELRASLHALRGLVSMWGLAAVANRMQACEKGPESPALWRREVGELTVWLGRSFAEIERRYPDLAKR